jgi:dGTPase
MSEPLRPDPDAGLAPYAQHETGSRGRLHGETPAGLRGEYQRDRDRIVHSSAFRRLVYKTQVFVNHEGDLYRTRLTHSLEVAQVARTIARVLRLNEALCEAISLAHDLGHTPFGHAGQDALNDCMRDYGGFEHNLQSLRVVDELEEKYAAFSGLNLTFESREGILKHCSARNAAALGELGRRFLDRQQPSLEAQLANVADEVAYNHHDVDDGLRAGLVGLDELDQLALFRRHHSAVRAAHAGLSERRLIHEVVRRMINEVITDLTHATLQRIEASGVRSADEVRAAGRQLVGFSDDIAADHLALKQFLRERVYRHFRVVRMTTKAQRTLKDLFRAYFEDVRLLPGEHRDAAGRMEAAEGEAGRARAVADYIAGMTDRFAISEHSRLYDPAV